MAMDNWKDWLRKEERFRAAEQDAILKAALASGTKTSLSQLRRAGLALTALQLEGKRNVFGGKVVLELRDRRLGKEMAGWRAGDPVRLLVTGSSGSSSRGDAPVTGPPGLIERSPRDGLVCVVFREEPDCVRDDGSNCSFLSLSLVKVLDDTFMFGRMHANLERFGQRAQDGSDAISVSILQALGAAQARPDNQTAAASCKPDSPAAAATAALQLNPEQQRAIATCLDESRPIGLIHGPPGTGKTQTLVQLLLQLPRNKRILVCGPSNLSVDNVLERYLQADTAAAAKGQKKRKIIRLGHPARVLASTAQYTLDAVAACSDAGRLLADVKDEMDRLLTVHLPRCKSGDERRAAYAELKQLRIERRERERMLALQLLAHSDLVFATLGTASGPKLMSQVEQFFPEQGKFDVVIVDEAGQALLPECLSAVLLAREKLILAGDHFQLPPTVMDPALANTLGVSLFETLMRRKGLADSSVMLCEQHRMNSAIMAWSNQRFYGGRLRAHESVAQWLIEGEEPLVFVDTAGFGLRETSSNSSSSSSNTQDSTAAKSLVLAEESKLNQGEAQLALKHASHLISARGVNPQDIAIISPYSAQVSLLQSSNDISDSLEIGSIDGFQGREKDAVILTLVRSNDDGEVGFLAEMRRLNVAMTRAKKHLYIIGDSETLERNPDLKQLVSY